MAALSDTGALNVLLLLLGDGFAVVVFVELAV